MDFYGLDRSKALARFDGIALGCAGKNINTVCIWSRLHPENLLELLAGAADIARGDARNLAALITRSPWRINLQAPAQGKANQLVGNMHELGLTAGGREYLLQLSYTSQLQLVRIFQVG